MEFWCYPCEHWISGPIFVHMWIFILPFQRLVFWSYYSKHWNSGPIPKNTGIPMLSFHCEHWNSLNTPWFWPFFLNIGISILFFQRFVFWSYYSMHWNSGPILENTGILMLSFHCKHCNSHLISQYTLIVAFFYTHWNSDLLRPSIGLLVLSFLTLEFLCYPWTQ